MFGEHYVGRRSRPGRLGVLSARETASMNLGWPGSVRRKPLVATPSRRLLRRSTLPRGGGAMPSAGVLPEVASINRGRRQG